MQTHLQQARLFTAALALAMVPLTGHADESIEVEMHQVSAEGVGESIGTVTVKEHQHGVLLTPELEGLEPGLHGFHLHENPDCEPAEKDGKPTAAAAAGGHYDPEDAGKHEGPFETDGHLGDLPALYVSQQGEANQPELAPRLSFDDFDARSLVIHKGGDNYSDDPEPLGGGGSRVACGVVRFD